MPKGQKTELIERLNRLLKVGDRYVDVGIQLRVWERGPDDQARPGRLLDRVYGGRYDRLARRYIGPPGRVVELSCHEGQLPLLLFDEVGVARVLALGPPGGGKTFAVIRKALLLALDRPNSIGGLIAPTGDRKQILWRDLLAIIQPLGWVDDISVTRKEITLANRTVFQVLAAKRPSVQYGSPLQGRSFDWACLDESQNIDEDSQIEIDSRGRRVGTAYCVFETATNSPIPAFKERLEQYRLHPDTHRILRYNKDSNPWVDGAFYDRMRGLMSEREYRERILVEDVPSEALVYPAFRYALHVKRRTFDLLDVTADIVAERYGRRAQYIVGQDFGVLVNASVVLKCFVKPTKPRERLWWAIDEVTTRNTAATVHARRILQKYTADSVIVIADPHVNTGKDSDKSDYYQFQREGLDIKPASSGYSKIAQKHRISMMNSLLQDANGHPSLYVEADEHGHAECTELARSLLIQEYGPNGEESPRKNAGDRSHWTAAIAYGLFPFERIRGSNTLTVLSPSAARVC